MKSGQLVRRSLIYYWRTNVAVVFGVATAVSILAGALLVGHSVRESLADLVRQRLGATDLMVTSPTYVREQLAADLAAHPRFAAAYRAAAPIIVATGVVTEQESGRRASGVRVYGVDDRFWLLNNVAPIALDRRDAALSPALAREIGARTGAAVLVRVQRPSDVPLESLQGRKDDVGRTLRLTTHQVLSGAELGNFAIDAQQGDILAMFVPLERLREELEVGDRVNTILVSRAPGAPQESTLDAILSEVVRAEDIGFTIRSSDDGHAVIVGSSAGLIDDRQAAAVARLSPASGRNGVFTYLANSMRVGSKEVPYSLVTGMDLPALAVAGGSSSGSSDAPPIVLNAWTANDLGAKTGDRLSMDYFVWEEPGRLATRSATFAVAGIVPIEAGGRDLAPEYPGISNTSSLQDWDPPFPIDLRRVRRVDEDYWTRYRTTPKAFVPLEVAQRLWTSRYGSLTSIRVSVPPGRVAADAAADVRAAISRVVEPRTSGIVVRDVRAEGLAASRGATDFGEYFVYFSFFLVVSALVLVVLFFKLGIEQRGREVGLLRAVGLSPRTVRRLFLGEGLVLALAGGLIGAAGAVAYGRLIVSALTTRWFDAVGTTDLTLHVSANMLIAGVLAGVVSAVACIWWTLRGLGRVSERTLLAGDIAQAITDEARPSRNATRMAAGLAVVGLVLVALSASGRMDRAGGFFGAGALLLVAALACASALLRRPSRHSIGGHGWVAVSRLAARGAAYRPARSVLSMSVIASATFVLVTVDAFRRDAHIDTRDRGNGTGGYALMLRTLLPIVEDPNSEAGRTAINLTGLDPSTRFEPFRLRQGDDASCLNLYQPTNPRILAPNDSFLAEGRFAFQASAASTDAERQNPWLLLARDEPDGAIPVIADANSMTYVLHRAIGDEITLTNAGSPIRLRFVASLRDSIFQSELLMSERHFRRAFPEQAGYRWLLVDTTTDPSAVSRTLENDLSDLGADAVGTAEYLASFHRVENTYLSTFQTLGGLGLLLGTAGLATVLLRNVLERRRELGLLAAVGYRRSHFLLMAAAENLLILVGGLVAGTVCAAIAIAPAVAERGGRIPLSGGIILLLSSVFAAGLVCSLAAMAVTSRRPLLESLRSE